MEYISDEQKFIVESESQFKLINGCAGSHKTDTLIKCAIYDLNLNKRPILFLTMVGSVTMEIKSRIEKYLNIELLQEKNSNHYIGYYNNIPICVSNFDAWIHYTLIKKNIIFSNEYSRKTSKLLSISKTTPCFIKNNDIAGLVIIDEAQDLHPDKIKIITNMKVPTYIAGDYLQSLFNSSEKQAMNTFKLINPTEYYLTKCFRCPKPHIEYNNFILNDIQKKYDLPSIIPTNDNNIDKPLYFNHKSISNNNYNCKILANAIAEVIAFLIIFENIEPGDIAIIMAKTNNNAAFFQIEYTLNKLYKTIQDKFPGKFSSNNLVKHLETEKEGLRSNINWIDATDKTVLLSIHGDKGKSHKVIFLLGVTERSIPTDYQANSSSCINAESLINVATTRSTKYLFIGFNGSAPSRYLKLHDNEIKKYAYMSWDMDENASNTYKRIANILLLDKKEKITPPLCKCSTVCFDNKKSTIEKNETETINKNETIEIDKKLTINKNIEKCDLHKNTLGRRLLISVTEVAKEFETTDDIFNRCQKINFEKPAKLWIPTEERFGDTLRLTIHDNNDVSLLLGNLSEILIQRILDKNNLLKKLNIPVEYTNDEIVISFMCDVKFYCRPEIEIESLIKDIKKKYPLSAAIINRLILERKVVVSSVFNTNEFKKSLAEFNSNKTNEELSSQLLWNITIFYNQIYQIIYKPSINHLYNYFNQNISILHKNINIFIKKLKSPQFELQVSNTKYYNNKIIGICGRIDIYDDNVIYEIKTSQKKDCQIEWITQTMLYKELSINKINRTEIVNVLRGVTYSWDMTKWDKPNINKTMKIIGQKFDWSNEIISLYKKINIQIENDKIIKV